MRSTKILNQAGLRDLKANALDIAALKLDVYASDPRLVKTSAFR